MATATFTVAASGDDQGLYRSHATYPPTAGTLTRTTTGTEVSCSRMTDGANFRVDNALLRWNTSSLPDGAVVTEATLRIHATSKVDNEARSLVGEFYAWDGASSADWSGTAPTTPVLSATLASLTTGAVNDVALTDFAGISTTGTTSLRLHVSGGQPSGTNDNYVNLAAYDHATLPAPELVVTYVMPGEQQATFSIADSDDDQFIYRSGSSYPPTGTVTRNVDATDMRAYRTQTSGGTYFVGHALLKWDTSSIPDGAVVTAATLRVWVESNTNADARNVRGELYAWDGASSADHTNTSVDAASAVFDVPLSTTVANADNDFAISNPSAVVNKSGYTSLRLHVSGGQPTGDNRLGVASWDEPTLTEARLIVTYTTAGDLVGMTGI